MSAYSTYDGPQLTGEAITKHRFCIINPTADPDTVVMADDGTTAPCAFVSKVDLESGQALYGIQDDGFAMIECDTGYTPVAGALLTSGANGVAVAATTADHVYAVAVEPASGAAGLVRAALVKSPIPLA